MGIFNFNMIVHLFLEVLKLSLWSGAAIFVILLISPALDKRYTSLWRYLLWIVFSLRLVLPFDISIPGARIAVTFSSMESKASEQGMQQSAFLTDTGLPLAALIWAAGVVCLFLWQVVCYAGLVHKLNKSKRYFTSKGNLSVYVSPVVVSPMLIGIRKPQIILPSKDYDREQLQYILAHEYTHYRRKDIWMKFLLAAARTVHWFNPFIVMMERRASKDMELLCDSFVVKGFTREERKRYSETLLACAAAGNGRHPVLCASEFSGNVKNIKERFANIFLGQGKKSGIFVGVLTIGGFLFVSLFVVLDTPDILQAEKMSADAVSSVNVNKGEEVGGWGYYLEKETVFGHHIMYVNNR